ncbi:hypothetical protein CcCBS67573_g05129 [Chytriomyces confervae]|uniref:Uncharacterized protein n=1 Tax=Chytriomyces confervae TaxID=246404 RepID=A0A507FB94_9FUNG|nr:hypothetical protein CcCBS67573_g05129 [Chytriomyces confervae]
MSPCWMYENIYHKQP